MKIFSRFFKKEKLEPLSYKEINRLKRLRNLHIACRRASGEKVKDIAKYYGLSSTRISDVCANILRRTGNAYFDEQGSKNVRKWTLMQMALSAELITRATINKDLSKEQREWLNNSPTMRIHTAPIIYTHTIKIRSDWKPNWHNLQSLPDPIRKYIDKLEEKSDKYDFMYGDKGLKIKALLKVSLKVSINRIIRKFKKERNR